MHDVDRGHRPLHDDGAGRGPLDAPAEAVDQEGVEQPVRDEPDGRDDERGPACPAARAAARSTAVTTRMPGQPDRARRSGTRSRRADTSAVGAEQADERPGERPPDQRQHHPEHEREPHAVDAGVHGSATVATTERAGPRPGSSSTPGTPAARSRSAARAREPDGASGVARGGRRARCRSAGTAARPRAPERRHRQPHDVAVDGATEQRASVVTERGREAPAPRVHRRRCTGPVRPATGGWRSRRAVAGTRRWRRGGRAR